MSRWIPPRKHTLINIPCAQEFSGSPVSWTQHSHLGGPGPTPCWGTKSPQTAQCSQREEKTLAGSCNRLGCTCSGGSPSQCPWRQGLACGGGGGPTPCVPLSSGASFPRQTQGRPKEIPKEDLGWAVLRTPGLTWAEETLA